jgi:hypothetical protein
MVACIRAKISVFQKSPFYTLLTFFLKSLTSDEHGKDAKNAFESGVARHVSKPNRRQGAAREVQCRNIRINLRKGLLQDQILRRQETFYFVMRYSQLDVIHQQKDAK